MKKTFFLSFIALLVVLCASSCSTPPFTVSDLKCENLVDPVAIDNTSPHLSWKVKYTKGAMQQQFYEIEVASDKGLLDKDEADIWNSGKVASPESVMVPYAGKALASRQLCYWRVRVWNDKGEASDWSTVSRFGVGVVGNDALQGSFIGASAEMGSLNSPLLRKKFTVEDNNKTTFLHVNSLGQHEVYVNGHKVNDDVLSPAVSQLNKRSLIVTYDLTHFLNKGENEVAIWLARGWYRTNTFDAAYDGPLVRAQVDVLQDKAWKTILKTDATWTGREGGYIETGAWQALQFAGERMDGNLVPRDLSSKALDALTWLPVVEVDVPEHKATPEMTEPNRIMQTFKPTNITKVEDNVWLVDMGKALNGWFKLSMPKLPQGHEVRIEYSDYVDKEGVFQDQGQSDIYIARGDGKDEFCNKFINHAFQYARIHNLPEQPAKEDIEAYLIYNNYADASTFECSDPDMNAIHNMIQYTMKCLAYSGYMVDCPHLERAGYGGDGNSSTEAIQTMFDVSPLFANWLQAWDDAMREGGSLPHVAPNPGAGGGGPYWCGFFVMAPWQTYVNYNDPRLIEKYYPSMQEWLKYVDKYTVDGLLKRWPDTKYRDWYLGDWLAPMGVDAGNQASIDLVNNCFISDCFATMGKIATVLGKTEDAKKYEAQHKALNELLHKTFYNAERNGYSTSSPLDLSYPMLVGVTPDELYANVKQHLFTESDTKYNGHIASGLVGVPIVTKWAINNKAVDYMYNILKQPDYPGYLHMINNGASTTWEYWNGERSRIHNCYNGIGTWFYQALGGIRVDENKPGYKHVFIEPQVPAGMTWAKVSKESPYGNISVDWKIEGNAFVMDVEIPVGCEATVILPPNAGDKSLDGVGVDAGSKGMTLKNGKHKIKSSWSAN